MIGALTALVAFLVDVVSVTVSDYKLGFCHANPLRSHESCCVLSSSEDCPEWTPWSNSFWGGFGAYAGFALIWGVVAGAVTMTTKATLPSTTQDESPILGEQGTSGGKMMYFAAGSGIPEIKTILSGFVIPHFLDFKVLLVKAVGATFAVSSSMCLGKEGPFVHISTCVGYMVASLFPKYRENVCAKRELLWGLNVFPPKIQSQFLKRLFPGRY